MGPWRRLMGVRVCRSTTPLCLADTCYKQSKLNDAHALVNMRQLF